jgi:hypothetical protein
LLVHVLHSDQFCALLASRVSELHDTALGNLQKTSRNGTMQDSDGGKLMPNDETASTESFDQLPNDASSTTSFNCGAMKGDVKSCDDERKCYAVSVTCQRGSIISTVLETNSLSFRYMSFLGTRQTNKQIPGPISIKLRTLHNVRRSPTAKHGRDRLATEAS